MNNSRKPFNLSKYFAHSLCISGGIDVAQPIFSLHISPHFALNHNRTDHVKGVERQLFTIAYLFLLWIALIPYLYPYINSYRNTSCLGRRINTPSIFAVSFSNSNTNTELSLFSVCKSRNRFGLFAAHLQK